MQLILCYHYTNGTVPYTLRKEALKTSMILFVLAISLVGLCSCPVIIQEGPSASTQKTLVMVWLDGDNNLNPHALEDFHEMEYGLYLAQESDPDILEKLEIIVQYDSNTTSSPTPGRYKVLPREDSAGITMDHTNNIYELDEPNMGDAEELADFISWCKTNHPADRYALILWNHGGGVRSLNDDTAFSKAICWDDTNDDDALYIGEIKDALTAEHSVDFLGMDACLMGFLEVAYEFRPDTGDFGADAIAFSPATEQGDGWEYDQIFSRLRGTAGNDDEGHPYYDIETLTANEFAMIVAQEYEDSFSRYSWETQTAVDLRKISSVKTAADALASVISEHQDEVEAVRGSYGDENLMAYFDESSPSDWIDYAGFDLYELAEQLTAISNSTPIQTASDALMAAVDDAILYSFGGAGYDGTYYGTGFENGKNGLAIFFPEGDALYNGYPHWSYQHWYNGVSHADYTSWWQTSMTGEPLYGAIDFCTSDGDGVVESWFELLQYWYNPNTVHPNDYNPSPVY